MSGIQPHFGPDDPGAVTGGLAGVIRIAAPQTANLTMMRKVVMW